MNLKEFCSKYEQLAPVYEEIKNREKQAKAMEEQLAEKNDYISKLEDNISKLGYTIEQKDNVIEFVKDESAEIPKGEYTNPIPYAKGMECQLGLFYTDGSDIWECILTGIPEDFTDSKYFDIIAI